MTGTDPLAYVKPTSNDDYIGKIRKRLQEDSKARTEREKRRRKVLVDQMKAHEAQEVSYTWKIQYVPAYFTRQND